MALGILAVAPHHSSLCLHGHLLPPPLLCIPQMPFLFSYKVCAKLTQLYVQLFATLGVATQWNISLPASSVQYSRQEYWSGFTAYLSRASFWPRDWTHISCGSARNQADSLPLSQQEAPYKVCVIIFNTTGTKRRMSHLKIFNVVICAKTLFQIM